jgi:predicted ArsR family transcriptional regulator
VHLNTIRAHLAALEQADVLVSAQKAASGPGRPAVEYRLVDGWGLSSTDFLELAGLLAAALVRTSADGATLRATGADWGRYLVGRPGRHDVATEMPRALERLGSTRR